MKKLIHLGFAIMVSTFAVAQQNPPELWEGKLNVGVELRLIFKISKDNLNNYTATLDIPEQGVKELKVTSVTLVDDSIKIVIGQFNASYAGKRMNDTLINGTFIQGMSFPLQLKKIKEIVMKVRPQTPVGPFPYQSQNITYRNKDNSITYGATITTPNGKGPFPAVLLLTGSGQQNRDEEIMGHKPFAVIADHLTRNGFIVLRVDDRGMGETTGEVETATTRDFANDANTSLDYLKSLKGVDKKRLGLIGHSEGGMIAQLVASERSDINFIVMLAGPGLPVTELMKEQNRAILTKAGLSKTYIDQYDKLYTAMLKTAVSSGKEKFTEDFTKELERWMDTTSKNIVLVTTGIKDEESKRVFVERAGESITSNWFVYFLQYDPEQYLKKIKSHVLALNGAQDVQVLSKSNLAAVRSALEKGKPSSYEIQELPGLNHLFQECKKCTVQEYAELDQTISPNALNAMTDWLKKVVKM